MEYDTLPEWIDLMKIVERGETLDPVSQFIYDNEPSGDEDKKFRASFQSALYSFAAEFADENHVKAFALCKRVARDRKNIDWEEFGNILDEMERIGN